MSYLSNLHSNEPAFYRPETEHSMGNSGITKREYFAAMALQGYLASFTEADATPKLAAEKAVQYADALLEELHPDANQLKQDLPD